MTQIAIFLADNIAQLEADVDNFLLLIQNADGVIEDVQYQMAIGVTLQVSCLVRYIQ